MKSMTGFGKAVCELPDKKVTIEIRSLNSRQLDLNFRVASQYRDKESEMRGLISRSLERGKIDFTVFAESAAEGGSNVINQQLALDYYNEIKKLSAITGEVPKDYLALVLRMPDVLKQDKTVPDETEWAAVMEAVNTAIAAFNKFRDDEGSILAQEFEQRIGIIIQKLKEVTDRDPQRIAAIRERLNKYLAENIPAELADKNRFEQELIYYIEKLDITEEKLRLQTHCTYFLNTMKEASSGRKLGFIAQEIGREINTIGSKANDAQIQKFVVEMKDELEKIKEQLLNVL
jgi:uncharacterized protein (TIGR00255 family)